MKRTTVLSVFLLIAATTASAQERQPELSSAGGYPISDGPSVRMNVGCLYGNDVNGASVRDDAAIEVLSSKARAAGG